MADEAKPKTTHCRFFNRPGGCSKGDTCPYLHVAREKPPSSTAKATKPCRYFAETGSCKDGDKCRFEHVSPPKDTKVPSSGKKKGRCRYFSLPGGCRQGDDCPFRHDKKTERKTEKKEKKETDERQIQVCRFFGKPGGCKNGQKCPFAHIRSKLDPSAPEYAPAAPKPTKPTNPIITELTKLQTKLGATNCRVASLPGGDRTVFISLKPSDPDFPFDLNLLRCSVTISKNYPKEPPTMVVTNPDDEIPRTIRGQIEKAWEIHAKKEPHVAVLIDFIDRHLERLLILKRVARPPTPPCVLEFIRFDKPPPSRVTSVDPPVDTDTDSHTMPEPVIPDPDPVIPEPEKTDDIPHPITTAKQKRGTEIRLVDPQFQNVGFMSLNRIQLVMACGRCKAQLDTAISFAQLSSGVCSKCHTTYNITLRAQPVHDSNNVLGYLDIEGATAIDMLPSLYTVTCLECGNMASFVSSLGQGGTIEEHCRQCHTLINVTAGSIRLIKYFDRGISTPTARIKPKKKPSEPGIVIGSSLPDTGTCKHYSKSYRWLRFPCCGRAFPCDVCHDEAVSDGHSSTWATRMICGHCSVEQPFSNSSCISCGGGLTGHKSTKFWEGGKGNRNKVTMSRHDSRKHKGSSMKTVSRKGK